MSRLRESLLGETYDYTDMLMQKNKMEKNTKTVADQVDGDLFYMEKLVNQIKSVIEARHDTKLDRDTKTQLTVILQTISSARRKLRNI